MLFGCLCGGTVEMAAVMGVMGLVSMIVAKVRGRLRKGA